MKAAISRQAGFSLLELLAIVILLSILSVSVYSRFDIAPFQTAGFSQELRSAIRFAQKFAVASGCDVQVNVNAGANSYTLSLRTDLTAAPASCLASSTAFPLAPFGTPLRNPAGGNFTGNPPSGTTITSGFIFAYNRQGIPIVPATGAAITADGTITVGGQNIAITAGTGYVP